MTVAFAVPEDEPRPAEQGLRRPTNRGAGPSLGPAFIDARLRTLARQETRDRLQLGRAAKVFLARQAHQELGFVRIGDYVRERLGMSTSHFYETAHVATSLAWLPTIASALESGEISWTKARELVSVAAPETQEEWLAFAKGCTADDLQRAAAEARRRAGPGRAVQDERDGESQARDRRDDEWMESVDGEEDIDGEPALTVAIRCPQHVRLVWWDVVRLSCQVAGFELATWQSAEAIAAEALSTSGWPDEEAQYGRRTIAAQRASVVVADGARVPLSCKPGVRARRDHRARVAARFEGLTPEQLDARMRAILASSQRTDAELGALLRRVADMRIHRLLGYDDLAAYCRNAVGFCVRKARALIAIERSRSRSDSRLMRAYESGALSWHRCLVLLPVLNERTTDGWIDRAQQVTARRLADEVMWARMGFDAGTLEDTVPPPLHTRLADDIRRFVHIRGSVGARVADAAAPPATQLRRTPLMSEVHIRFRAPGTVAHLLRAAIWSRLAPGEPLWMGLLRVVEEVRAFWLAAPRHRDPVFARDGWRCAVPGCSSRRNLHDHHVIYRSRGGRNGRENRVAVCAAHHHHCVHREVVRARGRADVALEWELGRRRSGGEPYLRVSGRGEVYVTRRAEGRERHAGHAALRPTA